MKSGMPYVSLKPEHWDPDTGPIAGPWSAHGMSPLTNTDNLFRLWPRMGLTEPDEPLAGDLSNIDSFVDQAKLGAQYP
jgi:hypothetical protein